MCEKESWGTIFATTEAHSTQRDQPPRMQGPGLWMYEQEEQRVTPVRMIGVNSVLWCPGWDGKDLVIQSLMVFSSPVSPLESKRRKQALHLYNNADGTWCRIGWVDSFQPKGGGFESRPSRHLGTLGKFLTQSCLWRFGVKLRHIIRAVSGALLNRSGLEGAL